MGRHTVSEQPTPATMPRTREPSPAPAPPEADARDRTEDIVRYFRTRLPSLLDGPSRRAGERPPLLRRARLSLRKGRVNPDHLSAALLRETLSAVAATPEPKTMAGAAPVGPRDARIWWDAHILDTLGDVLSHLDDPRLVLRFYDITGMEPGAGRWHETFDIDVDLQAAGKTVHFWKSDRSYAVDLGYVHADGRFLRLARTNTVDLPREGRGKQSAGETARSAIRPPADAKAPYVQPDGAAREWAALRPDDEGRDWDAELVVHMLYRAFLLEGPRALRRAPALTRRSADELFREFSRRRQRRRLQEEGPAHAAAPALLVRRLDEPHAPRAENGPAAGNPPAGAALCFGLSSLLPAAAREEDFAWHRSLLLAAMSADSAAAAERTLHPEAAPAEPVETERFHPEDASGETEEVPAVASRGVHIRVAGEDIPAALFATPVFEAAKHLRESLSGFRPFDSAVPEASPSRERPHAPAAMDASQIFDNAEAKRLAKAGVRISRMSLVLEGRMRHGARLKVAGKLVHTDADGNFRLECILSGRRSAIPMRAGTSISGEARSLISIDWSKRPNRGKLVAEVQP